MKYLIPKSYRVKHKILKFLSKERMKNGGKNPVEQYTFSLKEISSKINEKYEDVYEISDYLFYKNLLHFKKNETELMNPYCCILDDGIELYSSFELINEGKTLNTNLYSNITSIIFTIILGLITMFTVFTSENKSKEFESRLNELKNQNILIEKELLEKSKKILNLENSFQQMEYYQTNIQKNDSN